eukprot:COSAG06_NODE_33951_length_482_cov_0.621410_1_plen_94_part_01
MMRDGDWSCPQCHSHCYASRSHCFRCAAPRPYAAAPPAHTAAAAAAAAPPPLAHPGGLHPIQSMAAQQQFHLQQLRSAYSNSSATPSVVFFALH